MTTPSREAGEYLDAVLRDKRNGDKRNQDKDHDARKNCSVRLYDFAAIIQVPTDHLDATDWRSYVPIASMTLYRLMRTLTKSGTEQTNDGTRTSMLFDEWHAWLGCAATILPTCCETCAAFEAETLAPTVAVSVLSAEKRHSRANGWREHVRRDGDLLEL